MSKNITEDTMGKALDFAYDKAIYGVVGLDSAEELAESFRDKGCLHDQCNSLIRWQNAKAGTSGFLTGLGGLITMPLTLPVNVTSVLYLQIRMIAAIAHLTGHDLRNDKVKTMVYLCLVGSGAVEVLKSVGVKAGKKMAVHSIKNMSGKVIMQINEKVGFRLVTKFGEKGVINLGKTVPLLGGIIGGTFDTVSTNLVGNTARNMFVQK